MYGILFSIAFIVIMAVIIIAVEYVVEEAVHYGNCIYKWVKRHVDS